jgi:protein-disulfide isomerase
VSDPRTRTRLAVGATLAALIVVAVLIAVSQSGSEPNGGDAESLQGVAATNDALAGLEQSETTLGSSAAGVQVTEFGDLQCPACRVYADEVVPAVIDDFVRTGRATLTFENFTIIGPESEAAALASLAAAEQGRYWQFVELFYANQGPENSGYVTDAFLEEVARGAGVEDLSAWDADRASDRLAAQLERSQQRAQRLGLDSTPSFVVAGSGDSVTLASPTPEQLRDAIEQAESGSAG